MSVVFAAKATSVDGYITGPDPSPSQALGRGGGGPHPTAPLFVLSHRPAPAGADRQTFVATGIADAVAAAREAAGDQDVALMGSGVIRAAPDAGLLDEVIIHQVPILLGSGTPLFQPAHKPVSLQLRTVVPAPGVIHLHYEIHT